MLLQVPMVTSLPRWGFPFSQLTPNAFGFAPFDLFLTSWRGTSVVCRKHVPVHVKILTRNPHTGLLACPSRMWFELVEARVRRLIQPFVHMLLYMLFPCMSMCAQSLLQLKAMRGVYYMTPFTSIKYCMTCTKLAVPAP